MASVSDIPAPGLDAPNGGSWNTIAASVDSASAYFQSTYSDTGTLDWIRAHIKAFRALGPTIVNARNQATSEAAKARGLNRADLANDLQARADWLGTLTTYYSGILDEVDSVNASLTGYGFATLGANPIVPVAIIAVAVVIAGAMVYITFHTSEQSKAIAAQSAIVDQLAQGKITGAQATQLSQSIKDTAAQTTQTGIAGVGNTLQSVLPWIAVAAGLYFVVPLIGGRRRG